MLNRRRRKAVQDARAHRRNAESLRARAWLWGVAALLTLVVGMFALPVLLLPVLLIGWGVRHAQASGADRRAHAIDLDVAAMDENAERSRSRRAAAVRDKARSMVRVGRKRRSETQPA